MSCSLECWRQRQASQELDVCKHILNHRICDETEVPRRAVLISLQAYDVTLRTALFYSPGPGDWRFVGKHRVLRSQGFHGCDSTCDRAYCPDRSVYDAQHLKGHVYAASTSIQRPRLPRIVGPALCLWQRASRPGDPDRSAYSGGNTNTNSTYDYPFGDDPADDKSFAITDLPSNGSNGRSY
jgi:hypothetical protein